MLTLRLHEIECIHESSEIGSDEPYVLVVAIDLDAEVSLPVGNGHVSGSIPNVNVNLYGPYGDMDTGEKRASKADEPNFWNLVGRPQPIPDPERVIFVAALLENDDGDPEALVSIVEGTVAGALVGSLSLSRSDLVTEILRNVGSAIRTPTGAPNFDDRIGQPQEIRFTRHEISMAGVLGGVRKRLVYRSTEGSYGLTFELKSPTAASGLRFGHVIEHRPTAKFLAVDEDADDFRAAVRPTGQNERLRWKFRQTGGVYRVKNVSSGKFLDAAESGDRFSCLMRPHQDDDSQLWTISPDTKQGARVRQLSTRRFLDAFQAGQYTSVTRERQSNDTQIWTAEPNSSGRFLIRQKSSGRLLASKRGGSTGVHVVPFEALDRAKAKLRQATSRSNVDVLAVVEAQKDILQAPDRVPADQEWDLEQVGGVYEVEHLVSGRFLDAFEAGRYSVMTRERQGNDSQRWVVIPNGDDSTRVQHLVNGRYLDAFTEGNRSVVTRERQSDGTQDWIIHPR